MTTNNANNSVQHGLNAAKSNAANSQEQQQVEELSSQLGNAAATSSVAGAGAGAAAAGNQADALQALNNASEDTTY